MSHNTSRLRLCKDCPHARCTPGDNFQFRYWCGISDGDGVQGTALGIRPWYDKPHPKCPLNPHSYYPYRKEVSDSGVSS